MAKNLMGKSRKPGDAYVTVIGANGWKYEILKLYKSVEASKKDPYARAFCNVHGFATEMGDTYLRDIGGGVYAALEAKEKELAAKGGAA